MEAIFAPAIGLMNRLRYPIKFGLIFFIVLIPLIGLSVNLIATINKGVTALEHERAGLDYIKTLRQPMEHLQQHRGMMAAYLNGTTAFRDRIMKKRAVVDIKMAEAQKNDSVLGAELRTGDTIDRLMQQWQHIKDEAFNMDSAASIQAHNSLIADMLGLMNRIADSAKITLDPNLDSSYIGKALISELPKMLENMGQARAIASGVAAQGRFVDPKVYTKLSVLSNDIDMYFKDLRTGLHTAYENNAEINRLLKKSTLENNQAISEMQGLLRDKLLNVETIRISADQVFDTATQAIAKSYKLYDALVPVLDQVLAERIKAGRTTMIATLAVVITVLILVAYLFCGFYFSLRQNIALIRAAAEKLASGDLTTQVNILSRDEMTQIGTAINKIAEGVGQTVSTLVVTSDQFVGVANRLAASSQSTGNAVAGQSIDIEETARAIEQMAHAVQDVASNTAQAAVSAQQANDASVNGQQVVSVAVDSINQLAGDLSRVTGTIHKLEEQSQGISGILEVICSIADQTNLLALNAAIEAARAGEQGRGFAVVADEVRSLAQRTQNSTLEIQNVIEQLQANAQEAVSVMADSAAQINTSVEHASSAGNVLQELTDLVAGISDMNARIATSAEQQSTMANEISNNINNMNSASEQSATIAQSSVEDSAQAMALASEAHSILKRFHVEPNMSDKSMRHTLFQWDSSFSVGIAEIDRQHKILIQLVNELYLEMKSNSDAELLARILQGLIAYTASHFGYEEGLMARHGYEGLAAHKAKHEKLVAQVIAFQRRVEANDESVVQELLTFLNDWLSNHIKGSDKKYAAALTAKGVS